MNENYYHENITYSEFLDSQSSDTFKKYTDIISQYIGSEDTKFLDVGCGTGIALDLLANKHPNNKFSGVEINKTSVDFARQKGVDIQLYDGANIPFGSETFDIVGSINVLEHVDNVENFLKENLRVLKSGGYLIVACPNFLSITNNFHWHTTGIVQKARNILSTILKIISPNYSFQKMATINRKEFQPDDDACNIVNPIDLIKWARRNNLKIEYWSSRLLYGGSPVINFAEKTALKIFFGACLFIFRKNEV